ncbi:hypothetical protein P170DRAFT_474356 [Aspergillus steynii IBT 23096]|uniref:Tat pathway signal sequence n=1 Tax=Aspergillus steynii IBT 23096 TaxID=1392250 RepID=A0A2I2GD57_9EURO|nr:uncharacterized protein P170DRAFT_474356 [Aspergillus steynii IBT 23096]PLB50800.1 hypothetical protein P170DRAFT_474356 [Aspergillus steynii IBT 23096]
MVVGTYRRLHFEDTETGASSPRSSSPTTKPTFPWILHALLFGISVATGVLVALLLPRYGLTDSSINAQEGPIGPSRRLLDVRFTGTFNVNNSFKGPPNLETAAAWGGILRPGVLAVEKDTWERSKPQYPDSSVQIPSVIGDRSESKYMATLEVTHQLNCLYNLVKLNYLNHFEDLQKSREHNLAHEQERVDHCIDILRQKIMCDADSNLVTYNWVQRVRSPVANFNSHHQCHDFKEVMGWAEEHSFASTLDFEKPTEIVGLQEYP